MPYWQLFYHLVWHTRNRLPSLTVDTAAVIYGLLRTRAQKTGATVFAVNGHLDHVHLVVSIPPKLSIASFVGQAKSGCSAAYNRRHAAGGERFAWHEEYGVQTIDRRHLPTVISYVERQQEHHASGATIPVLEAVTGGADQVIRYSADRYYIDNQEWRAEMLAVDA